MTLIEYFLFDMDGLLLNTEQVYTDVTQEIVSRYGKQFTWDLKSRMIGLREEEAGELIVKVLNLPISPSEYLEERNRMHITRFPSCRPLPGVVKLIKYLKQNNLPICVATSSHRKAFLLKTQENQELFSLFGENIICGDDPEVKRGKPNPDIFLAAAKKLGHPMEEFKNCLVFEDAPSGVLAGIAAGMEVIWVPDENLKRDEVLTSQCRMVLKSLEDFDPKDFI